MDDKSTDNTLNLLKNNENLYDKLIENELIWEKEMLWKKDFKVLQVRLF